MSLLEPKLKTIEKLIAGALLADRMAVRRELKRIRQAITKGAAAAGLEKRCERLAQRLKASASRRQGRANASIPLQFDPALPITAQKETIIDAIREHQVLIVAGETGSGKTTQLPKLCLAAGRGVDGCIGVTQPRRIAGLTVSRRIAEELGEETGQTVGHKIRFQDATGDQTRIKIMTDGILLAEAHADRFLNSYDTLIVDEAHERSLNIDFILGILKKLLLKRRDLKLIITSATIDTEKFSCAFGQAPVIEVSGRMYPVETRYFESSSDNGEETGHVELAVQAVEELQKKRRRGDILIFMPTEQDIRDTCELLEGRRMPATSVIPLFARLAAAEQQKVFQTGKGRKIIVATNVAETSITIPGIQYVIDTGLARISQYAPRSRTTTLPVVPISRSSADQRKGRCGRVSNGICIRLFAEEDYNSRPRFTQPEILRANLAEVIMRMLALKLGSVADFPFIDAPARRSIQDGYKLLLELGAIAPAKNTRRNENRYVLTAKGRLMARLPLDPRLSAMLLEAHQRNCLADVVVVAAALSIQDPRERPVEKQAQADQAHARFQDAVSDFIGLLNIWRSYTSTVKNRSSWKEVKQFCSRSFLSFRRMREWQDIHHQILSVLAEHDIKPRHSARLPAEPGDLNDSWYATVHQSILSGFLSNIAVRKEKQIYQASHNRQVMIFPGSGLFKNPGQWVVAAEMVETSRLFARCAAHIHPNWLETVGRDQCKYTYLDPHWERSRGAVAATEQVSLFGLVIDRRPCAYGPIDPDEAKEIFIRKALIEGDVRNPLPFMAHNQRLASGIRDLEDRLRRKDILVDEAVLQQFFDERLDTIYDLRSLKACIRKKGGDRFLRLRKEDLMNYRPQDRELLQYPDRIDTNVTPLRCEYCFNPGKENDGVTVHVPAAEAGRVAPQAFQWLVPGLLKDKIAALIKGLPKDLRKQLVPVSETVAEIVEKMPVAQEQSLIHALSRFIFKRYKVDIPAAAWDESVLPEHLRMRIAVTDGRGRIVRSSRDAAVLKNTDASGTVSSSFQSARRNYERNGIEQWDFGNLPETILLTGPDGRKFKAWPSLELRDQTLFLTAMAESAQARRSHPEGVKALLTHIFNADVKYLRKNLKLPQTLHAAARYFGGSKTIEDQLLDSVLTDLFAKNVRRSADFKQLVQSLRSQGIAGLGQTRRQLVINILNSYTDVRALLHRLGQSQLNNSPVKTFLTDIQRMLGHLVPANFIQLYGDDRLEHLPRYISALCLRAQRGVIHLDKDNTKAQGVEPYSRRLEDLIQNLDANSSAEKRKAVEDFFWMIEELRVSVFAPEIGTAYPISSKRLEAKLNAIEKMV